METLKQEGKSQSGSRIRNRFLKGLVVAQVALALMLANGAVLLSVSYLNVLKTNKALDTEFVLSSEIVLDKAHYKTELERNRFWGQLVEHVKTITRCKSGGSDKQTSFGRGQQQRLSGGRSDLRAWCRPPLG